MEDFKEIRGDIKTLLVLSAKLEKGQDNTNKHLKKLNGSVAKHSEEIGIIKLCIKYNKGIIFGAMAVVSVFWSVISYLK